MAKITRKYGLTRGKILVLTVAMLSALLLIAACGGASRAGTTEPTDPPGPTNGAATSTVVAPQPTETEELPEPSLNGGANPLPLPGTGPSGKGPETETAMSTFESGIALGGSTGIPSFATIQYGANQQVGLSVTGRGQVTTTPDLAILNVGIEAKGETVEEARIRAARAMDRMVQALNARGLQSGDIQTQFFNIGPDYIYNRSTERQELIGYRVNNQVSVKIRDMGDVGVIINEVATAGGDLARIQGVSFTVEDTEALESQAREKAVANLIAKAQQFAQLAGVQLGKPIYLSESGGFAPRIEPFAGRNFELFTAATAPDTPISGGELKVTITVQGVFSIE